MWVVALVVPMLLLLEWLVDKESGGTGKFRLMAILQVALVFAIAFSAYHRMALDRPAASSGLKVRTTGNLELAKCGADF